MQGTVIMLMALSGLGCHHKGSAPAVMASCYAQTCYSSGYSGCYSGGYASPQVEYAPTSYVAPSCYSECYSSCYSAAYAGCYSAASYGSGGSCYGGSCYGGGQKHRHGLFGHRRKSCGACAPVAACYSSCYGGEMMGGGSYSPAIYGSYTPVYGSGQTYGTSPMYGSGQAVPQSMDRMTAPSAPAAPVAEPLMPEDKPAAEKPATPPPPPAAVAPTVAPADPVAPVIEKPATPPPPAPAVPKA